MSFKNLFLILFVFISSSAFSENIEDVFNHLLKEKYGHAESRKLISFFDKWDVIDVDDGTFNYGKTGAYFEVESSLFQDIARLSKKSYTPSALCLACGVGDQALRMALLGAKVKAYDIAPELVEIAQNRLSEMKKSFPKMTLDVEFHLADLASPEAEEFFPFDSFDIVTAKLFFHFISPSQQNVILKQIRNTLKTGGQLFAITQGPVLETNALQSLLRRIRNNPKGFDHGYALVHMAKLNEKEFAIRERKSRDFGVNTVWPYLYFTTFIGDTLELAFGRNIKGIHPTLESLPTWYSRKTLRSTIKHYKYNYATIEGTRNLLNQGGMEIADLRFIHSIVNIDAKLFPDTKSLLKINDEKEIMIAIMVYSRSYKSDLDHLEL